MQSATFNKLLFESLLSFLNKGLINPKKECGKLTFKQGSWGIIHIAMILLVFQVVAFVLTDELICVQDTFVVLIALHFGSVLPVTPNHDNSLLQLLKSFLEILRNIFKY